MRFSIHHSAFIIRALWWMLLWTALGLAVGGWLRLAHSAPPRFSPRERELGRQLFFDGRLAADGVTSCASCHDPDTGYSDGRQVAIGIDGQAGTRNTPTCLGAAYQDLMFHDGRTVGAGAQCLQPLVNPLEMGNASVGQVVNRLAATPFYRTAFERTYGRRVNSTDLARAMVAFEASLVSLDAPFDRAEAGYTRAMAKPLVREGYALFKSEGCAECHSGPLLTDGRFHNTGVVYFVGSNDPGRAGILPQQDRTPETIRALKTPTLREIARTAPYMHNGSIGSLEDVVRGYNVAWQREGRDARGRAIMLHDARQDARVANPRGWSRREEQALVAFLREGLSSPSYVRVTAPQRR